MNHNVSITRKDFCLSWKVVILIKNLNESCFIFCAVVDVRRWVTWCISKEKKTTWLYPTKNWNVKDCLRPSPPYCWVIQISVDMILSIYIYKKNTVSGVKLIIHINTVKVSWLLLTNDLHPNNVKATLVGNQFNR